MVNYDYYEELPITHGLNLFVIDTTDLFISKEPNGKFFRPSPSILNAETSEAEETKEKTLYSDLADCSDPLSNIVQDLKPVASIEEWLTSFAVLQVSTIGELCSLTLKALEQLPPEYPSHHTLLTILAKYVPSSSCNSDALAAVPISKSVTAEESSSDLPLSPSLEVAIETNIAIEENKLEDRSEEEKSEANSSESITNGQIIRK